MYKRNKGVTLIELIITLSLLSILFSFSLISIIFLENYENSIDVDYCNNCILELICNSKLCCKKENSNGYIQFDSVLNEITFYCDSKETQKSKKIEEYILPRKFIMYSTNSQYNRIRIDGDGFSTDDCTITFKDRKGIPHIITMRVGTDYVEIKS